MRRLACLCVLILALASSARAQVPDDLRVSIVVFGSGPAVWERFGHIALRFRSESRETDVSYDWGRFDFDQPGFIKRFMLGDPLYAMGAARSVLMIDFYRTQLGRTVRELELRLTPSESQRLLEWTLAQDNDKDRFYRYDYFRDNCSTRVRDGIDHATQGRLKGYLSALETPDTLRSEMRRLTPVGVANMLLLPGMDVLGGAPIDAPMSAWERAFVPMWLIEDLATTPIAQGAIVELSRSQLPGNAEPSRAPRLALWMLAAGVVMGGVIHGLIRLGRVGRIAVGVWSVVCVFICALLLIAWSATNHWALSRNANVLLFSPMSLVLLVMLVLNFERAKFAWGVVALGLASIPLAVVWGHDNVAALAFAMPIHFASALGLWTMDRRASKVAAENLFTIEVEGDAQTPSKQVDLY